MRMSFIRTLGMGLRSELVRCFVSPQFWAVTCVYAAVQYLGVIEAAMQYRDTDILYLNSMQNFEILNVFLPPLAYSTSFCIDWRYRYATYAMQRSSVAGYAWAKMVTAASAAFMASLIGSLLYFCVLRAQYPWIGRCLNSFNTYSNYPPFGSLLIGDYPFLYFVYTSGAQACGALAFAAVALAMSGIVPNIFVAMSAPLLCYYLVTNIVPIGIFNPSNLFVNFGVEVGGPYTSLLYTGSYAIAWAVGFGMLFLVSVKRRNIHG